MADPDREKVLRERADVLVAAMVGVTLTGGEARSLIFNALRQTAEGRDAEWCDAMWPANPEGAEPVTPSLGAEWYREQVAAARAEGERDGRQAVYEEYARDWPRHVAGHPLELAPPELSCVVCRLEIRAREK